jgi:nucleotide-binding universal stress UspA family protein
VRAAFPDWDVRVEAVADAPAAAILRRAEEWPADLFVVGAPDAIPPRCALLCMEMARLRQLPPRAVVTRVWPAGTEACVVAAQNRYWTEDEVRQWYHGKVDAAVEELRTAGLTASSVLREGHPQRVLLEESARWGADGVFVGSRGLDRSSGSCSGVSQPQWLRGHNVPLKWYAQKPRRLPNVL